MAFGACFKWTQMLKYMLWAVSGDKLLVHFWSDPICGNKWCLKQERLKPSSAWYIWSFRPTTIRHRTKTKLQHTQGRFEPQNAINFSKSSSRKQTNFPTPKRQREEHDIEESSYTQYYHTLDRPKVSAWQLAQSNVVWKYVLTSMWNTLCLNADNIVI